MLEKHFTIKELTESVPLSSKTWYSLIRKGEIAFIKTNQRGTKGGLILIKESAVENYLRAHSVEPVSA
jgi:excisionase family DNA binding protein